MVTSCDSKLSTVEPRWIKRFFNIPISLAMFFIIAGGTVTGPIASDGPSAPESMLAPAEIIRPTVESEVRPEMSLASAPKLLEDFLSWLMKSFFPVRGSRPAACCPPLPSVEAGNELNDFMTFNFMVVRCTEVRSSTGTTLACCLIVRLMMSFRLGFFPALFLAPFFGLFALFILAGASSSGFDSPFWMASTLRSAPAFTSSSSSSDRSSIPLRSSSHSSTSPVTFAYSREKFEPMTVMGSASTRMPPVMVTTERNFPRPVSGYISP
mmetsp:Transcript_27544/g.74960  ORF Transcript_27544/g.74960 Transcript_27544/m.74960 type:complete len:267 (+) Transcript_27544:2463-3263(+)